ncbi:MAG: T9SS type A sorting domain-containing protein [Bacteroidota bacterium]
MKKLLLLSVVLASALFHNTVVAQLSQGGTPFSFNVNSKHLQEVTYKLMPSFDMEALRAEDAVNDQSKGPYRFGYNHYVSLNLDNSGTWTTMPNGDRLWRLGVKSTGALTINLAFDDFFMPKGASMFVYNSTKDFVLGAFTEVNNQKDKAFATDLIGGEAVVLEYYEPASAAHQGRISLFRVTHGYRGVEDYAAKSFGSSQSCQVNVNCPLGNNWQNDKRGVVCLVVNGGEFCSGSLVNDVPQDGKPYVLTANHCSTSNDWAQWVFRFNWEAPGCSNPASSPSTTQSLSGSNLCARNGGSDFCLVQITGGLVNNTVPATYNAYFNGWSNINTPADTVIGIHHPSGDIKKISQATNSVTSNPSFNAGNGAADCWQIGQWTTACTEPGSSGSPLFDKFHHIVGQLYGGPSACGASAANDYDDYGKFAVSWLGGGTNATQLKHWLDPNNTGATTLNGWSPTMGVAENISLESTFSIYPNPSTGEFNIEIKQNGLQNVSIKVLNVIGQTLLQKALTNAGSGIYSLDLTNEPKGIYFVEISANNEKTVKKITIVK